MSQNKPKRKLIRLRIVTVYCIRNLRNQKCYVGSTIRWEIRKGEHQRSLRGGKHKNPYLQNAWNKEGEGNFAFKVLCICTTKSRREREQSWIIRLGSYNITYPVRDIVPSARHSKIMKRVRRCPKLRKHHSEVMTEHCSQPSVRARFKKMAQERVKDPAERARLSKIASYARSEAVKQNIRVGALKRWSDPVQKELQSQRTREWWRLRKSTPSEKFSNLGSA